MASSSLVVPNSFSRVAFEASSNVPWAPCLIDNPLAFGSSQQHRTSDREAVELVRQEGEIGHPRPPAVHPAVEDIQVRGKEHHTYL